MIRCILKIITVILLSQYCILWTTTNQTRALHYDAKLAQPKHYYQEAYDWAELITAPNITPVTMQILLNMAYFGYLRSQSTLQTQDAMHKAAQAQSHINYHFLQARLNPGLYLKHDNSCHQCNNVQEILKKYADAVKDHKKISCAYHYAIKYATESTNTTIKEKSGYVREQTRSAIAKACLSLINHVDQIIADIHGDLMQASQELRDLRPIESVITNRGILDRIWDKIQLILSRAFNKSDKNYSDALYKVWYTMLQAQSAHNALWRVIEEVRGAVYHAYYKQLYTAMKEKNVDRSAFFILFNESGLIQTAVQELPSPDMLSTHSLFNPIALS